MPICNRMKNNLANRCTMHAFYYKIYSIILILCSMMLRFYFSICIIDHLRTLLHHHHARAYIFGHNYDLQNMCFSFTQDDDIDVSRSLARNGKHDTLAVWNIICIIIVSIFDNKAGMLHSSWHKRNDVY
jgi:hypothetical protein